METHFLDIDYKNTCFYQYSKTPKEGFEEHTSGSGNVSYRKLFKTGLFGTLQSISIIDSKFQGKKLALRLMNGDEVFVAQLPMYDQRGNFDSRFIEPTILLLPNLVKNEAYRIFPWSLESETAKKKDGTPRTFYGVSIKKADLDNQKVLGTEDAKVEPKYSFCKKEETFDASKHIPNLEFVEEFGSYKPTAVSVDARKQFFVKLLEEGLKRLGYVKQEQPAAQEQAPTPKSPTKDAPKDMPKVAPQDAFAEEEFPTEDYDDLPF